MTRFLSQVLGVGCAVALLGACSDRQAVLEEQTASKESAVSDFLLSAEKADKNHVDLSLCENKGKWTVREVSGAPRASQALCVQISCKRVEAMPAVGAPEGSDGEIFVHRSKYGWICGSSNGNGDDPTVPGTSGGGSTGSSPGDVVEVPPVDAKCSMPRPAMACAVQEGVEFKCSATAKSGKEYSLKGACDIDVKYNLLQAACEAGDVLDFSAVKCVSSK